MVRKRCEKLQGSQHNRIFIEMIVPPTVYFLLKRAIYLFTVRLKHIADVIGIRFVHKKIAFFI